MKKIIILLLLVLCGTLQTVAQVGIGTNTPNANAALEVASTSQGVLLPRMTTAQRDAIVSPAKGLTVFNTTLNCIQTNIGSAGSPNWKCLGKSPSCNGTAIVSLYTCSTASTGSLIVGSAVSNVTQTITATVTTVGTYSISTTANGVTFAASGTFIGTGAQDIELTATGVPAASGINSFIINTTPNCSFSRPTLSVSETVLAQIGNEGDNPNTVTSVVTVAQINTIFPAITGAIIGNQTAYQAYIDANPNLFTSPATAAEVQAMINAVNANQTLLANIGTDADNGNNTLTAAVVAADYNALLGVSGAITANNAAYLAYIAANPNLFASPATAAEVQAMINAVNANQTLLANIGTDADNGNNILTSAVVAANYNALPGVSGAITANNAAYLAYIAANPNLFASPATAAEVQAMVNAVNASATVLAQIGNEGDNPNTVTSVVTVAQINTIFPAITGAIIGNQTAYQAYIDANPNLFASPATAAEVQAMINAVNASVTVLAQIGNEGDTPNTVTSVVTVAQINTISPAITGAIIGNQTAYQAYIDANPNLFASPATAAEVQAMINAVNANQTLLANIGTDADNGNNTLTAAVVAADYNALPGVSGAITTNNSAYLAYIAANPNLFAAPATVAEVQEMINAVNASATVLAQIGNEGDTPNTVTSVVTVAQINTISPSITGAIIGNQTAYQAYIDANPSLFASPATAAEVQAMINAVNNGTVSTLNCAGATNNGILTSGTIASGVSSVISYMGGNGGLHSGQTVTSTGVVGLTATLTAGSFASGAGSLTYNITGTPASSGTANFAINIGGQTCTLTRTIITVPDAPTSPIATAGNAQASVAFTAPVSNGGSAITGYTVTSSPGSFTATGASSPLVVTGLTNGTSYTFTVVATNAAGNSVASTASAAVTPITVPDAPTSPIATAGNAQASVAFTAPVSNGGSAITGYTVTSSPGGFTATGASSPLVVTGLTNGTAYTFTVVATNAAGNSVASTASAALTPKTVPGAPTSPVATPGNTQASVAFTAPASNGGSAITGYTVTSSPGSFTATGASSPLVVTGLTNGTSYTFTVVATNAAGNSVASTASAAVTPRTVPDAPTSPVATPGNAQASVAFTAPVSNGGSAITGYTVTSSPGGFTATGASSPLVVTGLTNGTSYTFTVVATNAAGNSVASTASAAVTPITVPGAPTSPVATLGNVQASVAFTAPVSNGGSAITGYTVTSSPGSFTATGASSPLVVTGLTNGTAYTFTVVATNAAGNSVVSTASAAVTPRTVPGAPTSPVATAGIAQASVAFVAPVSNGGSAITSYTVTSSPGGLTATGASSPLVVTGLTNGTAYTFTVVATNLAGNSVDSAASTSVTPTATVPGAPTSPVATPGNAQASVAFVPPVSNGGSAITSYTVTSTPGNFTATGASSPLVVAGLTNGTSYTFRVIATNVVGNSVASTASAPVIPRTVPGAPTSLVATPGNTQASVAFVAPVSNGGSAITSYTVTSTPGNFTATGPSSPLVVAGLTNGTAYTFRVIAINAAGNSVASTASAAVTPRTVPGAPTSPVATVGIAQASVAFVAPVSNGGSAITSYTVTSSPGGLTATGASSPLVVTGLTNGTAYTFTVVATNVAGNSVASAASTSVTPTATVPGAPTSPVATPANAQVSVSFVAPVSNGGSAITSYTVTSTPGNFTATGPTSPRVVTGLTNGTSYTFRVIATNAVGNSVASTASAPVIPRTVPGAPTSPIATPGNTQASIAFVAPVSNGGSAITSYTVTSTPGNFTATGPSSPLVVTGLTYGTSYTFKVVATNAAGNSLASVASASITPTATVPGAPTSPVATIVNRTEASVAFVAPVSNGGAAITSYTVTSTPGSITKTGASSPLIVTGLNGGTSYTFTVVATNAIGNSVASVASNAVIPLCGAFVASGVYKIFSCHNLGATTSLDPNQPVQGIHGNYYQWGRNTVVANASTGSGVISGWNQVIAPNGAWIDGSKTANDPCPTGFRVPTFVQWNGVINISLNTVSRTGTFIGSETNFGSAIHFGPSITNKTLTLPIAGYRAGPTAFGQLDARGAYGLYWSSTEFGTTTAGGVFINSTLVETRNSGGRTSGYTVRCISE
jgi:trimeric autotransporter adhesin